MQRIPYGEGGAVAALEALGRAADEVQRRALPDEVLQLWQAATIVAPERALDWWEGPDYLGKLLRKEADPSDLISAWMQLPPVPAFRRLDPEYPLGRRLLRVLPPGALLRMWQGNWKSARQERSVDPEERIEAWQGADPRGRRLRRDVPIHAVLPVWQELLQDVPLEAFGLLGTEDLLGRGLRKALGPAGIVQTWKQLSTWAPYWALQVLHDAGTTIVPVLRRNLTLQRDILPVWRRLATQFPLGAMEYYVTRDPPGPELRSVITPNEAVALWRSERSVWLRTLFLEIAPPEVKGALQPEDLLPLFESEVARCREAAIKCFGQVGRKQG